MINRTNRFIGTLLLLTVPLMTMADAEEDRVPTARQTLGALLAGDIERTIAPVAGARTAAELVDQARVAGEALWRSALELARLDDRPLYWNRLAAKRELRERCADRDGCATALAAFERASRGLTSFEFTADMPMRIAVTGFDPFQLDERIDQSNPSGVAALHLDGATLGTGDNRAQVRSVIAPVRFADFDAGLIEHSVMPLIEANDVDMLVTISMGRDGFNLERFPGRRRSATDPDNANVVTGASADQPLVPSLAGVELPGPEFVEFSLPAAAMQRAPGPYPINDNHTVTTLEHGEFTAGSLAELATQTAVRGSGGGYLSNEISFRTVRLVRERNLNIAVGHIHTPRISGHDPEALRAITRQIVGMLEAAVADR